MMKELTVIAIHGMGDTDENFDRKLESELRDRIGDARWSKVVWEKVYYQGLLQTNQQRLMEDTMMQGDVDWIKLRKFVLYGFSDAASMESRPGEPNSMYVRVQQIIVDSLNRALAGLGDARKPVVIVAHSLGCQVISNYIWDAQHKVEAGVFREGADAPISTNTPEGKFLRLKTLFHLFTSGCNIPIFIAGLPQNKIKPITVSARGWNIEWQNYYDPDDTLGWPLWPVNEAYKNAVEKDKAINAGGLFESWNPLSHQHYWKDDDFLDPVEDAIRQIVPP
jgi:pimeloyl-ACP methyl ester carboxylesterase